MTWSFFHSLLNEPCVQRGFIWLTRVWRFPNPVQYLALCLLVFRFSVFFFFPSLLVFLSFSTLYTHSLVFVHIFNEILTQMSGSCSLCNSSIPVTCPINFSHLSFIDLPLCPFSSVKLVIILDFSFLGQFLIKKNSWKNTRIMVNFTGFYSLRDHIPAMPVIQYMTTTVPYILFIFFIVYNWGLIWYKLPCHAY